MSEAVWEYNDEAVPDSELLYRRIPKNPDHRTFDPELDRWVPSAGALRRDANEGMSVHMHSVLVQRGRDIRTLYDPVKYGSIVFAAAIPRCEEAGVLPTTPTERQEPDPDLRAAHAEVRPRKASRDRPGWSKIVAAILNQAEWVQAAQ